MSDFTRPPTEQELSKLPAMANAVYAVRNAVRVRPLYAPFSESESEKNKRKK